MINSKRKGSQGERELSKKLREYGFTNAHRSQQYCGKGESSSDVIALPNIHIECKRVEKLNISNAMSQAIGDAKQKDMPTIFHRKNREEWLVTMRLEDWIEIYKEYYSGVILNETNGTRT